VLLYHFIFQTPLWAPSVYFKPEVFRVQRSLGNAGLLCCVSTILKLTGAWKVYKRITEQEDAQYQRAILSRHVVSNVFLLVKESSPSPPQTLAKIHFNCFFLSTLTSSKCIICNRKSICLSRLSFSCYIFLLISHLFMSHSNKISSSSYMRGLSVQHHR